MSSEIPSVNDLKNAARAGQRITPEDVSVISQAEGEEGPTAGSSAG